jgi:hypothetical protein
MTTQTVSGYVRNKGNPGRPANTPEVLWSKVDIRGPDDCWPWKGHRNHQGYGRTWINDVAYYAHRVIYDLANPGVIERKGPRSHADKGFIRHKCDNPSCCNPAHMETGSNQDNMDDKVKRNRQNRYPGCTGPRCKLNEEQVRELRALKAKGMSNHDLANRYGISVCSVKSAISRRTYKDIL